MRYQASARQDAQIDSSHRLAEREDGLENTICPHQLAYAMPRVSLEEERQVFLLYHIQDESRNRSRGTKSYFVAAPLTSAAGPP